MEFEKQLSALGGFIERSQSGMEWQGKKHLKHPASKHTQKPSICDDCGREVVHARSALARDRDWGRACLCCPCRSPDVSRGRAVGASGAVLGAPQGFSCCVFRKHA